MNHDKWLHVLPNLAYTNSDIVNSVDGGAVKYSKSIKVIFYLKLHHLIYKNKLLKKKQTTLKRMFITCELIL